MRPATETTAHQDDIPTTQLTIYDALTNEDAEGER